MKSRWQVLVSAAAIGASLFALEAVASTTVTYGRITAVRQVNIENQGAQAAGTLIGGALGVASGSGQSRSNRALRGVGGAAGVASGRIPASVTTLTPTTSFGTLSRSLFQWFCRRWMTNAPSGCSPLAHRTCHSRTGSQ